MGRSGLMNATTAARDPGLLVQPSRRTGYESQPVSGSWNKGFRCANPLVFPAIVEAALASRLTTWADRRHKNCSRCDRARQFHRKSLSLPGDAKAFADDAVLQLAVTALKAKAGTGNSGVKGSIYLPFEHGRSADRERSLTLFAASLSRVRYGFLDYACRHPPRLSPFRPLSPSQCGARPVRDLE